ncbi:hypothetical protein FRC03_009102 [Tulasnella sp. 419]|nr:hypothetical protein FRC03_009102 [Tulasnella sp. 419]
MPFITLPSGTVMHYIIPSCPDRDDPYIDPSKPTVLLLHPRFFDVHFFAPQYRDARLAKGYNLVAVDHHYHGSTECKMDDKPYDFLKVAKELWTAMDILKVKRAHIFGNSLGGPIALRMHLLAPERVESLTLCAKHPPVETEENLEQYRFLRDACYEKADDGSDQLASDVVYALHWIYFGDDPSAQNLVDEWVATGSFRPSNKKLITKIFSTLLDRKPVDPKKLLDVRCPVLIIHGGSDVPYPPEVAQDTYDSLPNADRELHIIPDAPHFLSWTHPAQTNSILANFLDRHSGVDSRKEALGPLRTSSTPIRPDKYSLTSSTPKKLNLSFFSKLRK